MGFSFGMGFGPPMGVPMGVNVGTSGFGPVAIGFGGPTVNGLGIGGPADNYPPNIGPGMAPGTNVTQIGGPPIMLGSSGLAPAPLSPRRTYQTPLLGLEAFQGQAFRMLTSPRSRSRRWVCFKDPLPLAQVRQGIHSALEVEQVS